MKGLNRQGVTVVLTTHYLEEAEQLCDRIAIINHGKLIANEPTRALIAKAQDKAVVVEVDRDIDKVPVAPIFDRIELTGPRTIEIIYRKDQVNAGDVLAALAADDTLDHFQIVEPRPGDHRVADMRLEAVALLEHRGDPALRPFGRPAAQFALGQHRDLLRARERQRSGQPRRAGADD